MFRKVVLPLDGSIVPNGITFWHKWLSIQNVETNQAKKKKKNQNKHFFTEWEAVELLDFGVNFIFDH